MTLLSGWPTLVDDSGDGASGTVLDKSTFDSIKAAVEAVTHSTTNTTTDPNDITDEVVTARGNMTDLNDRLDGVIDADGALITPASLVSLSQVQAVLGAGINLCKNSNFFLWGKGKAVAPSYYSDPNAGANGTISIAGTSETDTERKIGDKCLKLSRTSGTHQVDQEIIPSASFSIIGGYLKGKQQKVSFGGWVKTSLSNAAKIIIDDGVDTTTVTQASSGNWEWLSGTHTMNASATKLNIELVVTGSTGDAYFSGLVVCLSDTDPSYWFPEPIHRGQVMLEIPGSWATGDGKKYIHFARPTRIDNIYAYTVTVPTGDAISIDFEKWETAGWTSMITAGDIIDISDNVGHLETTGDYDHRCLEPLTDASGVIGTANVGDYALARLNVDTVGSTIAGADGFIRIDAVQCVHWFEDMLQWDDR